MAMPSRRVKGSPSMSMRSANVPLSPSSALTQTYFWSDGVAATVRHLMPAGNPAPPRPRSPEAVTAAMTSSEVDAIAARSPARPPCARKSSGSRGSTMPTRAKVSRSWERSQSRCSGRPSRSGCAPAPVERRGESGDVVRGHRPVGDAALVRGDLDERLQPQHAAGAVAHDAGVRAVRRPAHPRPRRHRPSGPNCRRHVDRGHGPSSPARSPTARRPRWHGRSAGRSRRRWARARSCPCR